MAKPITYKSVRRFFNEHKTKLTQEELTKINSVIDKLDQRSIITDESIQLSEELKLEGNTAFSDANFELAISLFSQAICINPHNYLAYSNRALAYQKMNQNKLAIQDCLNGIKIEPSFVKFYIRLALILSESNKRKAHRYCIKGLKYEPGNIALQELKESTSKIAYTVTT